MTSLDNINIKLPSIKNEEWKYSDLSLLKIQESKTFFLQQKEQPDTQNDNFYYIVILDGRFIKEQSILPKRGVKICIKKKLSKKILFRNKYQVLQNFNNSNYTTTINIDSTIDKPIKLLKIISSNIVFFTTTINLKENCYVKLHETFIAKETYKRYVNNFTKIVLEKNTTCKHLIQTKFTGETQLLNTIEGSCSANATYFNYSVNCDIHSYRFDSEFHLNSKYARAEFYGTNIANDKQHYDVVINTKHNASSTSSKQHYNQVLHNNSVCSFYSNVEVARLVNKVESHQLNKNIIMDKKSKAYSRPVLNISSEDVICSHGSSTGNIDRMILDYFASRGITPSNARQLIIIGLLKSVFSNCDLNSDELKSIYSQIENKIKLYE